MSAPEAPPAAPPREATPIEPLRAESAGPEPACAEPAREPGSAPRRLASATAAESDAGPDAAVHPEGLAGAGLSLDAFWWVACASEELPPGRALRRIVRGEWLALFRGPDGRPAALRDRCMHRNAPLSCGKVEAGRVRCPYHGWLYDPSGQVVAVPAEGPAFVPVARRAARAFEVREQQGYVYVRLAPPGDLAPDAAALEPYRYPRLGEPGWRRVRLRNRYRGDMTHIAVNNIDVTHTPFVHRGIFRVERQQPIRATIRRTERGSVHVEYAGEDSNLGWFGWFLNPGGGPIEHRDNFHMPNVTEVEYVFSPGKSLFIISQAVPEEDGHTLLYTDLLYRFGAFSAWTPLDWVVRRVIRAQGQRVIDQDVEVVRWQAEVVARYGEEFHNTAADAIQVLVESIAAELRAGRDPRRLPPRTAELTFRV